LLKPEKFAEIICCDYKLPDAFISLISDSISQQLNEFIPYQPLQDAQDFRILIKVIFFFFFS